MSDREEAAKRLGARVDRCVTCEKLFVIASDALTVESGVSVGPSGAGYACSFECAKAKVDALGYDAYVWKDSKLGGEPVYRPGKPGAGFQAASRLGVTFLTCAQCVQEFAYDPEEAYSVIKNNGDDVDSAFCCSHECASLLLRKKKLDAIWRSGKCGGTLMPVLEKP